MQFEREFIEAVFQGEPEYNEDVRERFGAAEVFDHALAYQREFLATRLERSQLVEAWNASQEVIQQLDAEASEAGMLGTIARLEGRGIEIPKFEQDVSRALGMISLRDIGALTTENLEDYYDQGHVAGMFSGFSLRFHENGDESFTPKLVYQLATNMVDMPSAHINLYSTGVVGESELIFHEDETMNIAYELLDELLALRPDRASNINRINLAMQAEKYDASFIRHIGHHASKVLEGIEKDDPRRVRLEDLVVKLISQQFRIGTNVYIEATRFFMNNSDQADTYLHYHAEEGTMKIAGQGLDFVFMPRSIEKGGDIINGDPELHAGVSTQGKTVYIPLAQIKEFSYL